MDLNRTDNFDFSDIEEALHQRFSDPNYVSPRNSLSFRAVIMPIEKLREYVCFFLQNVDIASFAVNYETTDIAAPENCLGPDILKQSASGEWQKTNTRNSEEPLYEGGTVILDGVKYRRPQNHPMTFLEIREAIKVSKQQPEIEQVFQVMRAIVQSYGVDLSHYNTKP